MIEKLREKFTDYDLKKVIIVAAFLLVDIILVLVAVRSCTAMREDYMTVGQDFEEAGEAYMSDEIMITDEDADVVDLAE